VTHIDVTTLDKPKAKKIRKMLDGYGLTISSLAYYPNPLHPEADHRETVIAHLKKVIEGAALLEVPVVGTFVGKDKNKTVPQNLEDYAKIWPPIVKFAKDHGVKIAIENCPMIFSYDNFGLNLDPSHLVLQMIDYERVIREFGSKIFHVHAKDLHIDLEGLYNNGVLAQGMVWRIPRLPGLGDMDWRKFFAALTAARYDYVVSIEHEDRVYEGDEELVKRGFYLSRDILKPYIH